MFRRRRAVRPPFGLLAVTAMLLISLGLVWINGGTGMMAPEAEGEAFEAVERFYAAEQTGDFGSSWELFHPLMQQRFDKAAYIQQRAHVILQDFDVKTFEYELGEPELLTNWKPDSESAEIAEVYQIIVTQKFHSPYGNFELVQPCYAAHEGGEWRVLWSYQKESAVTAGHNN